VVRDKKRFRALVDAVYAQHPELFPAAMSEGDALTRHSPCPGVRRIAFVHWTNGHGSHHPRAFIVIVTTGAFAPNSVLRPHVTAWVKNSDGVSDMPSMVPATRDEYAETRSP
jgi:hypothetical protein